MMMVMMMTLTRLILAGVHLHDVVVDHICVTVMMMMMWLTRLILANVRLHDLVVNPVCATVMMMMMMILTRLILAGVRLHDLVVNPMCVMVMMMMMMILTRLILASVRLYGLVVDPHVCDGHAILCQRPSLVWTDRRRRPESLDRLKILHETVLTGHPLSGQSQTDLLTNTDIQSHFITFLYVVQVSLLTSSYWNPAFLHLFLSFSFGKGRVQFSGACEQSHWWPDSAYSRRPSVISGSSSD